MLVLPLFISLIVEREDHEPFHIFRAHFFEVMLFILLAAAFGCCWEKDRADASAAKAVTVHSYSTAFPQTENSLSENGK